MKVKVCLISFFVVAAVHIYAEDINGDIDFLLSLVDSSIRLQGKSIANIPDFTKDIPWKVLLAEGTLHINCTGGTAGDFSTLKRVGNATVEINGNQSIMTFGMGLTKIFGHFNSCQAVMDPLINLNNELGGTLAEDSITAEIVATFDGFQCTVNVTKAEVGNLSGFNITTGGTVFDKIVDKIVDDLDELFVDKIKDGINAVLLPALQQGVSQMGNYCRFIPH